MKKQVAHVSVHQTSKVIASVYALIIFFIALLMAIFTLVKDHDVVSALFILILMPVFYWIVFYVGHVIVLFVYNKLFKHIGGVEFEFQDSPVELTHVSHPMKTVETEPVDKL